MTTIYAPAEFVVSETYAKNVPYEKMKKCQRIEKIPRAISARNKIFAHKLRIRRSAKKLRARKCKVQLIWFSAFKKFSAKSTIGQLASSQLKEKHDYHDTNVRSHRLFNSLFAFGWRIGRRCFDFHRRENVRQIMPALSLFRRMEIRFCPKLFLRFWNCRFFHDVINNLFGFYVEEFFIVARNDAMIQNHARNFFDLRDINFTSAFDRNHRLRRAK
jgi:hypothetical protein